jgi:hypothetical protein
MKWTGHVACIEDIGNPYNTLIETPEGKRPLKRPRPKWEDNIKMDLKGAENDGED